MYKSIKFSNIAVIEYRVLSNIPSPCTIFSIIEHNSEHFQDIGKKCAQLNFQRIKLKIRTWCLNSIKTQKLTYLNENDGEIADDSDDDYKNENDKWNVFNYLIVKRLLNWAPLFPKLPFVLITEVKRINVPHKILRGNIFEIFCNGRTVHGTDFQTNDALSTSNLKRFLLIQKGVKRKYSSHR